MKEWIKLNMPKSKDYSCPTCGTDYNDKELCYKVKGVQYPKYFNERKGFTPHGDYHNWDEVHFCKKCKQEYYFDNGAY